MWGRVLFGEMAMGSWNQSCLPLDRLVEMADRPVEPLDIAKLPIIEGRAHQQDVASMAAAMAQSEQESMTSSSTSLRSSSHHISIPSSPSTNTAGFVVVYKPEHFTARMCVFTAVLWLNLLTSLFVTCLAPICLGRYLMSTWLNRPVHEMYTWTLGAFVMICASKVIVSAYTLISNLDASYTRRIIVEWPIAALKALILTSTTMLLWPALIGVYANALVWPIMSSPQQIPIIFYIPTNRLWHSSPSLILLDTHPLSIPHRSRLD